MNELQKELLMTYIKSNIAPILIDFIDGDNIPNSILLPADCKKEELNGHYVETEFCPPKWFNIIESTKAPSILVIDKIDSITKEEQTKFIEILKYRKVSTFELPTNTVIVVTANKINESTINEEIYSLVAHIEG